MSARRFWDCGFRDHGSFLLNHRHAVPEIHGERAFYRDTAARGDAGASDAARRPGLSLPPWCRGNALASLLHDVSGLPAAREEEHAALHTACATHAEALELSAPGPQPPAELLAASELDLQRAASDPQYCDRALAFVGARIRSLRAQNGAYRPALPARPHTVVRPCRAQGGGQPQ